uniref:Kinetochore protein Spc24 n=1 Tax=Chaetoceros debilis TaxID=122233 RepID=A0A7S3PXU5_9STRA|eukprot:CAMPEP_0194080460 /NCGR_PEP_ID=MMETSP0149-20130528/6484_1 /TAXON_ID=122233 /ORGANISM="Chaetoceros debilis, Strain MM31A-1" /LENGTH=271 /DNA_ID=CAMNT_0038762183 /DNA_START=107 /DNA_END=922 /DNA_ORIENTATION=-
MKRKGEEYVASPLLSVMMSSPQSATLASRAPDVNETDEYRTIELPSNTSASTLTSIGSFSPVISKSSWESTSRAMNQLLRKYGKTNNIDSNDNRTNSSIKIMEELALPSTIRSEMEIIRKDAQSITGQIKSKIEMCTSSLSAEQAQLTEAEAHISSIQTEVSSIAINNAEVQHEMTQLRDKINHYSTLAEEQIENINEVEMNQKEEVYRLQTQISLHAHVSGIKWDYDESMDYISGEIDMPQTKTIKRFSLERADFSSFDLANHLWEMMEG